MAKKFNASQFKSKMRQIENKYNQQVRKINQDISANNRNMKKIVNEYNRAVRQHNSKVIQNRSRIQSELRKLTTTNRVTTTYGTSVKSVHSAYEKVAVNYDVMEQGSAFQEYVYSEIEQENANNLATATAILDNFEPTTLEYSLQDTKIIEQLSKISTDLDNRWKGALFSLNPNNPDSTRHFCTSTREIFTEIFNTKATDADVFSIMPNCEKTNNGNASRRSKIKYFLYKKGINNDEIEKFVDTDIENILELFHTLSKGTHGEAGKYSINQLSVIKQRVENGLIFLCNIAG